LNAEDYCNLLKHAPVQGIAGGRTYDAVILACALKVGVTTLITFNARHFLSLPYAELEIIDPGK
jgi:predicted nucleic acid-binding protein